MLFRSAVLDLVATHGHCWLAQAHEADARAAQLTELPLAWRTLDEARTIDFLGYAYTRTPSEISGALMTRYDETRPEVWRVPLRDRIVPDRLRAAPGAGYLVPAEHAAWVGEKLAQHGIRFERLTAGRDALPVQAFRATAVKRSAPSMEGRPRVDLAGAWAAETRAVPAGSLFVPIAQPLARLEIGRAHV